ncbi:hypothetical protein HPHPH28_0363 [Helicobacter pylori Hp H-28]|nr:hypothetical protein HPHPH28_0363 [Helicobacter pylori Hp H-28]
MWLGDFSLFVGGIFDRILKILKTLFVFLPQVVKKALLSSNTDK